MTPGVPPRLPLLSQRLVVVTGKGGVGKTTVTAALAHAAAASGRRVLAVEVSRGSLGSLLGGIHRGAGPMHARAGLAAASLEPEALLGDFVEGVLRFRILARRLLESTSFQVLAAAAPGLGEFLVLHRLLGWVEARRGRRPVHDLVIVDAPASGHSLPLLAAPHTLGALAGLGPVAELLARLQRLIADPGATLVCVVTTPEELAVRETVELHRELGERLGLAVAPPIVNALPPRRFTARDAAALDRLEAASGPHPYLHAARFQLERRRQADAQLTALRRALGASALAGRPSRVSLAGIGARGAHLDALLLDVKRTFDELVRGLATTPEQARAVLENRLYQNLSGTLAGTAEYMAVEQVYRLAAEGGYDLLVVDTPPARHAVDFLDAPRRLANPLDSRAFAILKDPTSILPAAGSRLAQLILAAVLRGLERFTGIGLVREVGEFVGVIEALTGALRERVRAVGALLTSDGTMPLLVTAPEPRLVAETEALVRALGAIGLSIHGIVVNRALARATFGRGAPDPGLPDGVPGAFASRLAASYADLRALGARQEATLAPLVHSARAPVLAEVPLLATDPGSLADLATIARYLFPDPGRAAAVGG